MFLRPNMYTSMDNIFTKSYSISGNKYVEY